MQKPLSIFEMADNHMGDVAHGSAVIQAFSDGAEPFRDVFRFAFKLQYRDLDFFIHPAFKGRDDVKYVKRFDATRLAVKAFDALLAVMRECGFLTACIDAVVSFLQHQNKRLTILHCVAEYPTRPEKLAINQVELLRARQWSKYARYELTRPLAALAPVMAEATSVKHLRELVLQYVEAVCHLLGTSGVSAPGKADLEPSHHYGLDRFGEHGLTMLRVVNRAYCKKILVLLPGQAHPRQFHKQKEETFVVLHGSTTVSLDGVEQDAKAGDVITVERGVKHGTRSAAGCVFAEISSTHHTADSFYTDPAIAANLRRKKHLTHWM